MECLIAHPLRARRRHPKNHILLFSFGASLLTDSLPTLSSHRTSLSTHMYGGSAAFSMFVYLPPLLPHSTSSRQRQGVPDSSCVLLLRAQASTWVADLRTALGSEHLGVKKCSRDPWMFSYSDMLFVLDYTVCATQSTPIRVSNCHKPSVPHHSPLSAHSPTHPQPAPRSLVTHMAHTDRRTHRETV